MSWISEGKHWGIDWEKWNLQVIIRTTLATHKCRKFGVILKICLKLKKIKERNHSTLKNSAILLDMNPPLGLSCWGRLLSEKGKQNPQLCLLPFYFHRFSSCFINELPFFPFFSSKFQFSSFSFISFSDFINELLSLSLEVTKSAQRKKLRSETHFRFIFLRGKEVSWGEVESVERRELLLPHFVTLKSRS